MSAFPPKADILSVETNARFVPIADVADATEESLIWNLSNSDKEASHSAAQSSSVVATLSLFFSSSCLCSQSPWRGCFEHEPFHVREPGRRNACIPLLCKTAFPFSTCRHR